MSTVFRVNDYQRNWQREPDVVVFDDGSFLVVFESFVNNQDDGPEATVVSSQRFDPTGAPIGSETLIDGVDGAHSGDPRITVLSDGGYAVVWLFDNFGPILTTDDQVYVRAYDQDGTPRMPATRVDTVASNEALPPEVFATENGGFKVVFGVDRSTDLFDQIYSQQFTADGQPVGGNTLVNTVEGQFDERYARSTTLTNGTTITIWNSESALETSGDNDSNELRGMLTDTDGAVIAGDFGLARNYGSVAGGSGGGYDVTALQSGGFVITHMNYDFELGLDTDDQSFYTMMRFFDAAGAPVGAPVIVYASDNLPDETRVTQLTTGDIVVTWSQDDDAPSFVGDTIYGKVFTASGRAISDRFDVGDNVASFNDQDDHEIAALPGGAFVVAFTSEAIDNDDEGVAARIFQPGDIALNAPTDPPALPPVAPDPNAPNDPEPGTSDPDAPSLPTPPRGTSGRDTLRGDDRDNMLDGLGGADRILGLNGDDTLLGGGGKDVIIGGGGADEMRGQGGKDVLRGGKGDDAARGDGGADKLIGNKGLDGLDGGRGRDQLKGGGDADTLHGGAGQDTLIGGGGADVFRLTPGDGRDRVKDYLDGTDKIDLSAWGVDTFAELTSTFTLSQQGRAARLDFDDTTALILSKTEVDLLGDGDFLF